MFLLNSRLGHFSSTLLRVYSKCSYVQGLPFFRSYGDILQSSLTRVISRALEFSSCPPVSVLVRSPSTIRSYFLKVSRHTIGSPRGSPCASPQFILADLPARPQREAMDIHQSTCLTYSVTSSSLSTVVQEYLT